jgi:hypothetical protein
MSVPRLVALATALAVMVVPATASAAVSTFDRLEVIGTADGVIVVRERASHHASLVGDADCAERLEVGGRGDQG